MRKLFAVCSQHIEREMSRSLCRLHYVYLCENVVQITYAQLEASAVGIARMYFLSCLTDGSTRHSMVSMTI